jgi:hypothetical protein
MTTTTTGKNKQAMLIEEFLKSPDIQRMEQIADQLAEIGERDAIDPLLYRLGDIQVQEDPDVEDSVCGALSKLKVMQKLGNQNFRFVDKSKMAPEIITLIEEYRIMIPQKYFD